MPDDPDRTRGDDSLEAVDPAADDTELIAYLDGELDGDAAAEVEARLARDAARATAEAYRKSFDLLDFLPKPEPNPDFTSRTLTRLHPAAVSPSQPIPAASGGVPALPPPRRAWPELLAWVVAVALVLAVGYAGHSALRPLLHRPPPPDEPTLADLEVIERLPLYLGVDDLPFLRALAAADLFDGDAAAAVTRPLEPPAADERAKLIAQFRALPPARQQQLRGLHQELTALDPPRAAPLRGTLDRYAAWLDRLPDADRRKVLAAPTAADRLDAVRHVREAQWRAALTPRQKERLKTVPSQEDRENLAAEFRDQEQRRRNEWRLAQYHWQKLSGNPWPFSDEKLARQVDGFVRTAFGVDLTTPLPERKNAFPLPPGCRLTREQYLELKALHDAATRDSHWFSYGACLLRLSDALPTLPPPRDGKPVVSLATLPPAIRPFAPKDKDGGPKGPWLVLAGRWPDFALHANAVMRVRPKFDASHLLGPCRPGEFADEVNEFLSAKLLPVLTPAEKESLDRLEKKWPEYPQRMIELARKHDLSVPGVTLPGEPSRWNELYRFPAGQK